MIDVTLINDADFRHLVNDGQMLAHRRLTAKDDIEFAAVEDALL